MPSGVCRPEATCSRGHTPWAFPPAKAAAQQALAIDDGLVEAHIVLGWIAFYFDWDWVTARRELEHAIQMAPDNADAHRAFGHMLSNLGLSEDAIREGRRARELDPLSLITNALEGQFLLYAWRDRDAEARFRETLAIDPGYWVAHSGLGRVFIRRGQYAEAIAELSTARTLAPDSLEPVTQLGYALGKAGRRRDALAALRALATTAPGNYVPAYNRAMIHLGLGEHDLALTELERAVADRELQLTFLRVDIRWDELRATPRFAAVAKQVRLE